jgi:hypothetical protein
MLRVLNRNAWNKELCMTVVIQAMPYLLAGIALYACTAFLFCQELLGQLKAIRVRSRRTSGRQFLR